MAVWRGSRDGEEAGKNAGAGARAAGAPGIGVERGGAEDLVQWTRSILEKRGEGLDAKVTGVSVGKLGFGAGRAGLGLGGGLGLAWPRGVGWVER